MKINKTNAARLLDKAGTAYSLVPYRVDENDLSAAHIAHELGEDVNRLFKTLVLQGDRSGHFVCVIPGGAELDMKKAARASGNKSCAMLPLKDLLAVTGYLRGGCSPVGMKKPLPTYIDSSALAFATIYVSAGLRGLQFLLDPQDLINITRAVCADLLMTAPAGDLL